MSKMKIVVGKCKTCGCNFSMLLEDAREVAAENGGFIPCEQCGSHATDWKVVDK